MKRIASSLCAGLATLFLLTSTAHSQNGGLRFSVKDLNVELQKYFPVSQSTAYSINNNGEVAGNVNAKGERQCFYYPARGTPQVFYVRNHSYQACDARAIDALGNVAGSVLNESSTWRAFRRNYKGTLITLETSPPGGFTYGLGISNGAVVGYITGATNQSAKWDTAGTITNLLPNLDSVATGINASGQIVGYYHQSYTVHGFVLSNGSFTSLPALNGGSSWALAINANGYIAGSSEVAGGCFDVAVWYGTTVADLGNCMGWPLGISRDNWIVGYTQGIGSGCDSWGIYGACNAFLSTMTPNCTGPYDLNTLLDSSGAGWILKEATAINDNHQIVGYGIAPSGEHHAFLLTPNNLPLCYPD